MQLFHNASAKHKLRASVLFSSGMLACCSTSATLLASASVTYVQGTYSTPQAPQTSVSITYTGAQANGDLNVIVVGWNDSTATVTKVSDTVGNVYSLAVGPTIISGVASQSIYYAANIAAAAAGANTVTVTFSTAAVYPDIRTLEYAGAATVGPVDVASASSGNSAVTNSGSATTASANDLIVGANLVLGATTGPGSGFTQRLLTSPDGDIVEDQFVTAAGSYSATAPQNPSAAWIMQMVAFKAAGGSTSPCDLNADGAINVLDVQLATDMDLGTVPCSGPSGICNAMFVQDTLNAALGQPCNMTVVSASPSSINFGNVVVGDNGTLTGTLAVSGTGSTTISQISVTPPTFTIAGPSLPLTLATGQNAIFNVVFTPTSTGSTSGSIAIVSNALNSPASQAVSGYGVNLHQVTLTWAASTSQNVAGYNIYRIASVSQTAPAPNSSSYTRLNSSLISGLTYTDSVAESGTVYYYYYYYATAVDTSNNESAPSNTAQAVVPIP